MEAKFHKATIRIVTSAEPDGIDTSALIYGDTGLGLNRSNLVDNKGRYTIVVHIPTGLRIGETCTTVKQARLLCRALAPMADWKNITPKNVPKELGKIVSQVRECIESHGEGWKLHYDAMRLEVPLEE